MPATIVAIIVVAKFEVKEVAIGLLVTAIEGSDEAEEEASEAIVLESAMLTIEPAIRPKSSFATKQAEVVTFWL